MNQQGMIGYSSEKLVELDLLSQGVVCLLPSLPDTEYDMVAYIDGEFLKIQVKTGQKNGETIRADIRKSANPRNPYKKLHYNSEDVDIFAITDMERRKVAYYHAGEFKRQITLRLNERTCNNAFKERMFDDYADFRDVVYNKGNSVIEEAI
ncbi:group I intron-associated PD-(D/E)XK endonuclease [Bacillus cereus]|uniref:group I intron-associated PD-(D/E)XK endonuclease n=1 Tax=Bacillus cereus TaxID=1396 RepID=UPI0034D65979